MQGSNDFAIPVSKTVLSDSLKLDFMVYRAHTDQIDINDVMKGGENIYIYTQEDNCLTQAEADEMMAKAKHICNDCQCN